MPQAMQPWEYNIASCYSKSTAEKISKKHTQEFQNVFKSGYLQKDARCWSFFRTGKKNAPVCS